ncbi:MAG: hypothetical protein AVDCRST_MAG08-2393 [uncultured Acetobacteraceae bacterium]|uniref:Uncharacterized protein n=1 Tax=uncultured Acetobacteraceae bacterium TaxID=169975 RepID=A0A6J4IQC3_9PROT|nr:MAG: hypothetical protein AVDCRST_MAG08-2393 [uncultured Acetobacteraceae bacterium]
MDLANGPLPWRAPDRVSTDAQASPWGDFLQRVLLSVVPATQTRAETVTPDGARSQTVAAVSDCHADLPAG